MKPYLLSTVSALAISGAASAADMPLKAPMLPQALGWAGLYLGAHGGVAWLDASQAITGPINITTCSTVPGARCDVHTTGAIFGGQIGYNWQSQNWVFGIEADASGTSLKKTQNVSPATFVHDINEKVDWLASVRGRLGWAMGDTLVYGTGGVAFGHFDAGWLRPAGAARAQFNDTATGWVAGGGIERMFSRNWSARLEFLHYGLGRSSFGSTTGGTYTTAFRHDVSTVRLGINFRP